MKHQNIMTNLFVANYLSGWIGSYGPEYFKILTVRLKFINSLKSMFHSTFLKNVRKFWFPEVFRGVQKWVIGLIWVIKHMHRR